MKQKIELNASGKALLAKAFKVSVQNVSQALLFRRNSPQACKIREAALKHGGRLLQIHDVTVPREVKILNSKGEVIRAVVLDDTAVE